MQPEIVLEQSSTDANGVAQFDRPKERGKGAIIIFRIIIGLLAAYIFWP
jgi:hypothetical protein